LPATAAYHRALGDGLAIKSLADARDIERLAAFNGLIFGEGVAAMTRELILNHPRSQPEHWLFVEDEGSGQIVSTLCLIPWTLRYESVTLRAGEAGIVGTREAYRRRGLVRALFHRHAELLRTGDYDLSHIQGIPYFYRQFGYEYALPLEGGWRVDLHLVPALPPGQAEGATLRLATLDDLPLLTKLYAKAVHGLDIHTVRDESDWRYLFGPSKRTEMTAETWLVLDTGGQPVGYLRVPQEGFGEGLIVNEATEMDADTVRAVLRWLRVLCGERHKPHIRLCLPENSVLVRTARYWGAHDLGHYAWQIRIVDTARLLRKLAPILERRLAASALSGLTQNVCLNLYREAFELRFEGGRLAAVEPLGFSDRGGIRIPPLLLAPLLLGYRDREELARAHHDVSVSGEWQHLVDILFPKVTSFIHTIY
jgi:predicted N-acetyltransferase YhbS